MALVLIARCVQADLLQLMEAEIRDLEVFESQTLAVRSELSHDHTYDFVEGVVGSAMNTAIEGVSDANDEYFVYYKPFHPRSFDKALEDLGRYIIDEGPFDGVMAFSHGCSLAAAFILERQRQAELVGRSTGPASPLKCAVFFCGRLPHIDSGYERRNADGIIRIPTAHIWGANDRVELSQGLELSKICDGSNRFVLEHEGGHEVPGSKDQNALVDSVHTINRMLKRV